MGGKGKTGLKLLRKVQNSGLLWGRIDEEAFTLLHVRRFIDSIFLISQSKASQSSGRWKFFAHKVRVC